MAKKPNLPEDERESSSPIPLSPHNNENSDKESENLLEQALQKIWNREEQTSFESIKNSFMDQLMWATAAAIVEQILKTSKYLDFIRKADEKIFNLTDEEFDKLTTKEIISRRNMALTATENLMEFVRKFSLQNKEFFEGPEDKKINKVRALLASVNSDDLEAMLRFLEEQKSS